MKKKKKKQPCVLSKTNFSSWSFRSLPFLMVSLYSFPWFFFSSIYWIILHPLNISFWGNLLVFLNTWPNHPLARLSSFPQQVIFPLFLNHIHFFILSKSSVHVIKIQQSFTLSIDYTTQPASSTQAKHWLCNNWKQSTT